MPSSTTNSGHILLKGAAVLTAAGLVSRLMGFFFRIFLSHAFGEETVGLYQLIFPVYALCLSLSTAGLQTAVSRMTAARLSTGRSKEAGSVLSLALGLALLLSCAEMILLQQNAERIAGLFLGDPRCAEMLLLISYALPWAAVHSCICGFSLGMQKTKLPAVSQLVEQTVRNSFVLLVFAVLKKTGQEASISIAAAGITAGELAAAVFSIRTLTARFRSGIPAGISPGRKTGHAASPDRTGTLSRVGASGRAETPGRIGASGRAETPGRVGVSGRTGILNRAGTAGLLRELLGLSLPLTMTRAAVTMLQSVEAASIPACLRLSGMSSGQALSLYGVLTGMAMPCILFPSAVTGSVGTVLMPAVSAAQSSGDRTRLIRLLKRAAGSCMILGLAACLFFLLFGNLIGQILFHSATAGKFILTLAWICPFLYTNSALMSAVNGLGKTARTFLINTAGLIIRIAGVFLAIPRFGIRGWLWGLLLSQAAVSALCVLTLVTAVRRGTALQKPD